jgi:hypothetical protein
VGPIARRITDSLLNTMDSGSETEHTPIDDAVNRLNRLATEERENFRKGRLPQDGALSTGAISSLLQLFKDSAVTVRLRITSGLGTYAKDKLVSYARAMAILAVRQNSPALVHVGLTALAVEAGTGSDGRDSMVSLVLLYHSAVKLGMDASQVFEQAAALVVNDFREAIRQFPCRPSPKLDLEAWGWEEAMTKDGFDYRLL